MAMQEWHGNMLSCNRLERLEMSEKVVRVYFNNPHLTELEEKMLALIDDYSDGVSVPEMVGILEMIKLDLRELIKG